MDVTPQDLTHRTPLHMASSLVSAKKVILLIQHRADIYGQDHNIGGSNILTVKPKTVSLLIEVTRSCPRVCIPELFVRIFSDTCLGGRTLYLCVSSSPW